MVLSRSPALLISYAAYLLLAIMALIVILALRMPSFGASFAPNGGKIEAHISGQRFVVNSDTPISFTAGGQRISTSAAALAPNYEPSGSQADIADWFLQRSRLVQMGATGKMSLQFTANGKHHSTLLIPRSRGLPDLSIDVWLLLMQGFFIGLMGFTVLILRPSDPGGQIFAASCAGVLLAAFSGALFDARELTADGVLLRWAQGFNFVGSDLCGAGIAALFLWKPRPLLGRHGPIALLSIATVAGVVSGLGLVPIPFFYVGLALLLVCFLVAMAIQWLLVGNDPLARSFLRWVGTTAFIGSSILTIAMATPKLLGIPSVGGDGLSFLPLFIVYGGIAFGVVQFQLFDLDAWAIRLGMGALGALALLIADALLIVIMGVAGPAALAISVLLVGFLYFPARRLVWRLAAGPPAISDVDLFQSASDVAFTLDPEARRHAWRRLLQRVFNPLEMVPVSGVEAPILNDRGLSLSLPCAADDSALVLRYRSGGHKLFDRGQLDLAAELIRLMRRAEATREDYARGAQEERQRIARDLHDDVSSRLLTSLHRQDVRLIRSDLRKVMSDIRTMVSALSGERVDVDQAIADLRFETAERLENANLTLDWPVSEQRTDNRLLTYEIYRNLTSSHREVVSNILRHANASAIRVRVESTTKSLSLKVQDNGVGFESHVGTAGSGHGLNNIRARLASINGFFSIQSDANGTCVLMSIPMDSGRAATNA
jgi:two-component system sensor histidine kinase DevS